jgi:acetyl-CoA C-acetyltransferase
MNGNNNTNNAIKVREVYMGNVVSAGIGQAPARQAVMGTNGLLPQSTICTTVNKVCASGMKAVMLATQTLQLAGSATPGWAMVAGGMESMSNIPHYLQGSRNGFPLGNAQLVDGVIHDGLWDVYNNQVCN